MENFIFCAVCVVRTLERVGFSSLCSTEAGITNILIHSFREYWEFLYTSLSAENTCFDKTMLTFLTMPISDSICLNFAHLSKCRNEIKN